MGERVRYVGRSQNGKIPDWAGGGEAEILDHQENRPGFANDGSHGTGYLVKFKDTGKTLWVRESELEDAEEEEVCNG